jgi:hypothetical protein
MPKSEDLQMQSGPSLKSPRKRIEQGKDEFTHDCCNIIPSGLTLNTYKPTELFVMTRLPSREKPKLQFSQIISIIITKKEQAACLQGSTTVSIVLENREE